MSRSHSFERADLETPSCPICKSSAMSIIHGGNLFQVVRCGSCGLSYLNPRVKEEIMKKVYEEDAYFSNGSDSGYTDYASQEKSLRITFRRFIKQLTRFGFKSGKLLEIGCGYGFFLEEAIPFFSPLFGTELSGRAASEAEKLPGVTVRRCDLGAMGGDWNDFDYIAAFNVIEHIYDPVDFLESTKRRLKTGGRIIIATPDFGSLWYKILKDKWPSFKIPEHVVFYDRNTLRLLLQKAGFAEICEIPFHHAFPVGLILSKLGLKTRGKVGDIPLWIPGTMVAMSGLKIR